MRRAFAFGELGVSGAVRARIARIIVRWKVVFRAASTVVSLIDTRPSTGTRQTLMTRSYGPGWPGKHDAEKGIMRPMESPFEPRPATPEVTGPPALPIVTPAERERDQARRRSGREKYGGLFYLGLAGLLVVVSLVGWFASNAWSLRAVWFNVYVLHDQS